MKFLKFYGIFAILLLSLNMTPLIRQSLQKEIDQESQKNPRQKLEKKSKSLKSEESNRIDKESDDLPSIYKVIVRKNLFRPLGWTDKKSPPPFVLCGIVRTPSNKKVLIQRKGNPEEYYVGVGEEIASGYKVDKITENTVKLKKDREEIVLRLSGWVPLGGTAHPSSSPAGKPYEKSVPGLPHLPKPPAAIKRILKKEGLMLEEVKRNPSLRKKLKRKYEKMIKESSSE